MESGASIDIQLKCSENVEIKDGKAIYDLEAKNYNDLVQKSVNPRILVVLRVPEDENQWLQQSDNELTIRNCAYWSSLQGQEETGNTSKKRVEIPSEQRFTPDSLKEIFQKASEGEDL